MSEIEMLDIGENLSFNSWLARLSSGLPCPDTARCMEWRKSAKFHTTHTLQMVLE